ncbi:MAG: D-glycero-beta-D-manno-heptose 1-phosphate adenylyltransferase, partial [Blastocatellia bacterium]|nr:D-glycero-beta-D-manno-heptose 1-phosphate adenylyltransferase [Blastocatellia bacterium]
MIVFTNGCFDILHPGHVDLLKRAKALGTKLIVGINSDASVRKIKGDGRPFQSHDDRAAILAALESVDEVVIFEELTPETLIHRIKPDVLVKGGDWKVGEIIGADFVLKQHGGQVLSLPLLDGFSSSKILDKLRAPAKASYGNSNDVTAASLSQHIDVFQTIAEFNSSVINECAELIIETFKNGSKLLLCG